MSNLFASDAWWYDPGESNGRPEPYGFMGDREEAWIVHDPSTDCPACGYPAYCPCASCFRHVPAGMFPYHRDDNGMEWQCGNCGFTESIDERTERQMEIFASGGCGTIGELTL